VKAISRRRFLASSAATLAAASAAAIAGCGRRGKRAAPSAAGTARRLTPVGTRGGILRAFNFDAQAADSLDPHLTQMGPIADVHSAVFSRVLRYEDVRAGELAPELAAAMPEQPDDVTYIVRLRDGVTFHDTPTSRAAFPPVAGRALTADDVKFSIERQADQNSPQRRRFFHSSGWRLVDSIEVRDSRTLAISLKTPTAPFLSMLAGRHAFIVARETVDATGQIAGTPALIGTGPFVLDGLEPGVVARLRRNPQWSARDDDAATGGGRPYLDGYDAFYSPQEDVFQRVAFERRAVDTTGFSDLAVLDQEHKTNLSNIVLEETDAGGLLASRFLLDRAPFKDDRVRRAVQLAVDRAGMAGLLYPPINDQPSAKLTGPVAPAMGDWATPEADLLRRPGYRSDSEGRAADIAAARQLWSAAMGDGAAPPVRVLFAGVPRAIPERAVAFLQRQLREALGLVLEPAVDTSGYLLIAAALERNLEAATAGVTSFTFGFEDGGLDIDDWLYPRFRSGQPQNTYRLEDAQLDAMLDKLRGEFDNDARRRLGLDVQDYLMTNVNPRVEYLAPVAKRLTWGYVRNSHMPLWYGELQRLADTWLDTQDDSWGARPA